MVIYVCGYYDAKNKLIMLSVLHGLEGFKVLVK